MTFEDTTQWESELLQKIGAYGASDPELLHIAASICKKQQLSAKQLQYVAAFEAKLRGELPHSQWGSLQS